MPNPNKRFKVSADDLFLGQRGKIKAISVAKQCGLDGVSLDMGSINDGVEAKNLLKDPEVRKQFLEEAKKDGIEIACMGFFGMYAHVYPELGKALETTQDWVETMANMHTKLGMLPLAYKSDPRPAQPAKDGQPAKEAQPGKNGCLKDNPQVWKATVEILKKVAPRAEQLGVVMGVESNLDADGYKRFLDDVGSPAVKVVYNPGRALEDKYDPYADIRALGKDRICIVHLEQGSVAPETWEHRLGDGPIDFKKLRAALMEIGWGGWFSIARSRLKGTEKKLPANMTPNAKYVHEIFPE
jgi:sugar phosphate isomerase/epimerase